MSELLAQAAAALNAPEAIVKRSAEARARAGGISTDEVLAAWAGGGSVATAAPAAASAPTTTDQPAAVEPAQPAAVETVQPGGQDLCCGGARSHLPRCHRRASRGREIEIHEPSPLGDRIKTAGPRAWTGSLLGLLGASGGFDLLLTAASLDGQRLFKPSVLVTGSRFVLATALMSVGLRPVSWRPCRAPDWMAAAGAALGVGLG